ncbi:S-methyl-5-thioribose-1-phosphate isomerase [Uliginosibacterium gangwonense]|uniref:S-methyl-5-thioribose-1-phosphate isomerase n=1 Tax=Uliginosibacterium gangwonense TaxID=392736 RepID=UPI00035ED44C|nr:S-methyl-5-thioribose-1-phosphate isomerase [Uliginosibacterium gangwonense]
MLFETIRRDAHCVTILDQTILPLAWQNAQITTLEQMAQAIRSMQVRGAPLIGASAAYGLALGLLEDTSDTALTQYLATLESTRPTAVNLHWALARMDAFLRPLPVSARSEAAWQEADRIREADIAANHAIGKYGLSLIKALTAKHGGPIQAMTHCNAGALATCGWGTALAPIYLAHEAGIPIHVWVSETRPRNQGLLTAAELTANEVPHTLMADNAAGFLLQEGRVDMVIVGADRIAANGDTANKVGTYLKALAAHAAGVPFYVAAPWSTIDLATPNGRAIPIEERNGNELRHATGKLADGSTAQVACIDAAETVFNPAFDVTPAELITGIITERGVFAPHQLTSH